MPVSSVKIGGKEAMPTADRGLFARLLVVAQTREMDVREVFKYSQVLFRGLWLQRMGPFARLSRLSY